MTKKTVLALLMILVMSLSGCSLILRDSDVDALQTVLEVNGEIVNKATFMDMYSYNLYLEQQSAQIMAQFGFSDGSVDEAAILQNTFSSYIQTIVCNQKAAELGFDQFSDEDHAQIEAAAQEAYDEQLQNIKDTYFASSELSGEELDAAVADYAADLGYTLENMHISEEANFISERLRASVTDPVTIDDSDLQAALDEKVNAEKESYASNLAAYGVSVNQGTATYYTPAGYRAIRMLTVAKPEPVEASQDEPAETADEAQEETPETADDTQDETEPEAAVETEPEASPDPALEEARAQAEELAARIADGEAFDELGIEPAELVVCESSTDIDDAVIAAAMALPQAGDVSDVVETDNSFVLIEYVDELPEHADTLDEVRDELYDETLTQKQDAAYEDALTEWINAAEVNMYPERLN